MTSPTPRSSQIPAPASPESTGAPASTPEQRPSDVARPSFVQITASVLTALTSTVALSYLGVAGTLIGAAVAAIHILRLGGNALGIVAPGTAKRAPFQENGGADTRPVVYGELLDAENDPFLHCAV